MTDKNQNNLFVQQMPGAFFLYLKYLINIQTSFFSGCCCCCLIYYGKVNRLVIRKRKSLNFIDKFLFCI